MNVIRLASLITTIIQLCNCLEKDICRYVENHPNWKLLPSSSQCGDVQLQSRIMGGEEAKLGEYPWMALLLAKDVGKDGLTMRFCGGSLISEKYVLTAAHCIDQFNLVNLIRKPGNFYKMFVRLGEHNLISDPDTQNGVTAPPSMEYEVESWLEHGQYKLTGSFYNDIALLRLKDKAKLHDFVQPICLPKSCKLSTTDLVGKPVTVAGWGSLMDEPKVSSQTLQKVSVRVVDTASECPYTRLSKKRYPTLDTQMCARSHPQGSVRAGDACTGDSGGPLMYVTVEDYTFKTYQVGIVSTGEACSKKTKGTPGIYTRVSTFMPWILNNMKP